MKTKWWRPLRTVMFIVTISRDPTIVNKSFRDIQSLDRAYTFVTVLDFAPRFLTCFISRSDHESFVWSYGDSDATREERAE